MFFARWRARRANRILIDQVHGEIVAAARAPALFQNFGVADDLDGRFEMLTLHAGLVLGRLGELGPTGESLAQDLVDCVFERFDDALREMAIGDAGVVKRMKSMFEAFYGRNKAYGEALKAGDDAALAAALARNVFARAPEDAARRGAMLAARVKAQNVAFAGMALADFVEGRFRYPIGAGERT